jgi:hypothetical protein
MYFVQVWSISIANWIAHHELQSSDNLGQIDRNSGQTLQISKGIVSRDFVVCFLVPFDRSHISKHQEWVLLLLKVRFRIEFFDFRVRP